MADMNSMEQSGYIPMDIGGMMRDSIQRGQQLSEIQRANDARAATEEYNRLRGQEATMLEKAQAAISTEWMTVSALRDASRGHTPLDPNFVLTKAKLDEQSKGLDEETSRAFRMKALAARSDDELMQIRLDTLEQRQNENILDHGEFGGLYRFAAAATDPLQLAMGAASGGLGYAAKAGLLVKATEAAASNVVMNTAAEAVLQDSNPFRTVDDLINTAIWSASLGAGFTTVGHSLSKVAAKAREVTAAKVTFKDEKAAMSGLDGQLKPGDYVEFHRRSNGNDELRAYPSEVLEVNGDKAVVKVVLTGKTYELPVAELRGLSKESTNAISGKVADDYLTAKDAQEAEALKRANDAVSAQVMPGRTAESATDYANLVGDLKAKEDLTKTIEGNLDRREAGMAENGLFGSLLKLNLADDTKAARIKSALDKGEDVAYSDHVFYERWKRKNPEVPEAPAATPVSQPTGRRSVADILLDSPAKASERSSRVAAQVKSLLGDFEDAVAARKAREEALAKMTPEERAFQARKKETLEKTLVEPKAPKVEEPNPTKKAIDDTLADLKETPKVDGSISVKEPKKTGMSPEDVEGILSQFDEFKRDPQALDKAIAGIKGLKHEMPKHAEDGGIKVKRTPDVVRPDGIKVRDFVFFEKVNKYGETDAFYGEVTKIKDGKLVVDVDGKPKTVSLDEVKTHEPTKENMRERAVDNLVEWETTDAMKESVASPALRTIGEVMSGSLELAEDLMSACEAGYEASAKKSTGRKAKAKK